MKGTTGDKTDKIAITLPRSILQKVLGDIPGSTLRNKLESELCIINSLTYGLGYTRSCQQSKQ
jgi:hypothetical protein